MYVDSNPMLLICHSTLWLQRLIDAIDYVNNKNKSMQKLISQRIGGRNKPACKVTENYGQRAQPKLSYFGLLCWLPTVIKKYVTSNCRLSYTVW